MIWQTFVLVNETWWFLLSSCSCPHKCKNCEWMLGIHEKGAEKINECVWEVVIRKKCYSASEMLHNTWHCSKHFRGKNLSHTIFDNIMIAYQCLVREKLLLVWGNSQMFLSKAPVHLCVWVWVYMQCFSSLW